MGNFLKRKLGELIEERADYERRKSELLSQIDALGQQLASNSVLLEDYASAVSGLKEQVSKHNDTIVYYTNRIEEVARQLEQEGKEARNEKASNAAPLMAAAALIVLLTLGIFLSHGAITGFLAKETLASHTQELNLTASQSTTYAWQLETAGNLRSVSVSGKLIGNGTAKVYLEKAGIRYLILDSTTLSSQAAVTSITGFAVAETFNSSAESENAVELAEIAIANLTEDIAIVNATENVTLPLQNITASENVSLPQENATPAENATLPAENVTQPVNITVPSENDTAPAENASESETAAEKAINQSLEYNAGTPFDANDDGVEFNTSAIDFTVENTNFTWAASSENLCTQWIVQPSGSDTATSLCYGSSSCCALLEVAPESSSWNTPFEVFEGRYGATANSTISSRVIYANYSLEPYYMDVLYSSFSSLSAVFVEPQPVAENATAAAITEFNKICSDTCVLSGLNYSSYTLIIEVENATLEISSITYTIATTEEIDATLPKVTILSPQVTVYNTTLIPLNFTIDEPVTSVWYVLNSNGSVAIASNTTITAANGTNTLALFAKDLANNTGSDEVIFSVILPELANITANITNATANATLNITPYLKALKKDYKPGEDAGFEFEYLTKNELTRAGKWKDEDEQYEEGYEEYLKNVSSERKAAIENAVKEKEKVKPRKQVRQWVAENETVSAAVLDVFGNATNVSVEITELREGKFGLAVPKQRAFRAGLYTLELNFTIGNATYIEQQNFTWGVLAINTNKSIFLPSEDAFIAMAVLNDKGEMVCDANVTLAITDPTGIATTLTTAAGNINISPECQVYGVTNLPDYYANYTVSGIGTYVMNLTAATANGVRNMLDNFTVQGSVDFDVARSGPTRIYPLVPYAMNMTIAANSNYNGLVVEYVPSSFAITPQQGMTVTTTTNAKVLSWEVQLKKGDMISLVYEFDALDVSPEFYILGELGIGTWKEARQWQIASDAPAKTDDQTLTAGSSSVDIGATTTITLNTRCINAACSNLEVWLETTAGAGIEIPASSCTPGQILKTNSVDFSACSSCSAGASGHRVNTGSMSQNTNTGSIVWTVEGCEAGSSSFRQEGTNDVADLTVSITVTTPAETIVPNVSILTPAAFANISGSFLINISANDTDGAGGGGVASVNVTFYNNTGNASLELIPASLGAGAATAGYWNATIDTTNTAILPQGDSYYNISVNATDTVGNTNITNISVIIDNTKANVTIVLPANGTTYASSEKFLINASVNDSLTKVFNATFRLATADGSTVTAWLYATRATGTINQGYWNATFDSTTVSDADYNITINATDFAGNQQLVNISQVTIENLANVLKVDLGVPAVGSSTQVTQNTAFNVTVNVTCNDACGNVNATLRYNKTTLQPNENISVINGTTPFYIISGAAGNFFYDFNSTEYPSTLHNASYGNASNLPSNGLYTINTTEFNEIINGTRRNNYTTLRVLADNLSAEWLKPAAPADQYSLQEFTFRINENEGSISNLNITINFTGGKNTAGSGYTTDVNVSVWNSSHWESFLNCKAGVNIGFYSWCLMNISITQNISKYVNETDSNAVYILVLSQLPSASLTFSSVVTDYISLNVTASGGATNPYACGSMAAGASCNVTWAVNATGALNSDWYIDANFTSDVSSIKSNDTGNAQITITGVSNTPPEIFFNYTNASTNQPLFAFTPIENSTRANLVIRFNVTDAQGASDISDTTAAINISLNTSYSRNNNSANCELIYTDTPTNGKGYECTIPVAYYDNASSEWKINVSVADLAGAVAYNDSMNITVNSLSALRIIETELSTSTSLRTENNEITVAINNTGNFNFKVINITPYALNASITDVFWLTGNFSINGSASPGGQGHNLTNGTPLNISKGITSGDASGYLGVPVKSYKENGGNSTLYIYIDIPAQLTSGITYNSSRPWELFGS